MIRLIGLFWNLPVMERNVLFLLLFVVFFPASLCLAGVSCIIFLLFRMISCLNFRRKGFCKSASDTNNIPLENRAIHSNTVTDPQVVPNVSVAEQDIYADINDTAIDTSVASSRNLPYNTLEDADIPSEYYATIADGEAESSSHDPPERSDEFRKWSEQAKQENSSVTGDKRVSRIRKREMTKQFQNLWNQLLDSQNTYPKK